MEMKALCGATAVPKTPKLNQLRKAYLKVYQEIASASVSERNKS